MNKVTLDYLLENYVFYKTKEERLNLISESNLSKKNLEELLAIRKIISIIKRYIIEGRYVTNV